jgi:hypothetical protein
MPSSSAAREKLRVRAVETKACICRKLILITIGYEYIGI